MASASVTDPVQKLFVDRVREFKSSNKGLDQKHSKAMEEEMARLRRVYQIQDESKLTSIEVKFPQEHHVSLHDIDEDREQRAQMDAGNYNVRQIGQKTSELLATIPDQTPREMDLPHINKPDPMYILNNQGVPRPPQVGAILDDRECDVSKKMTVKQLEEDLLVIKFGDNMPTVHDDKSPERDTVNFPRHEMPEVVPPRRLHIIPESWFQFFYPKTGVTGPYTFFATFGTFMFSKEHFVMEHEMATAISTTIIVALALNKFGPKLSEWARGLVKNDVDNWDRWQAGNIEFLDKMINHYKKSMNHSLDALYEIRKQDVEAQLECEHRSRLKKIHDETKRRLDYLVAVANSQRQINHSNMVNWVISNAITSFGPKQEADVLDNCIINLRQLGSKNANLI